MIESETYSSVPERHRRTERHAQHAVPSHTVRKHMHLVHSLKAHGGESCTSVHAEFTVGSVHLLLPPLLFCEAT